MAKGFVRPATLPPDPPLVIAGTFPDGAVVARGPGRYTVAYAWGDGGYTVHVGDGATTWPLEAPVNPQYPYLSRFTRDGNGLLLASSFVLRRVDLATSATTIVETGGGILGAAELPDGNLVVLCEGLSFYIADREPDTLVLAAAAGLQVGQYMETFGALHVIAARLWPRRDKRERFAATPAGDPTASFARVADASVKTAALWRAGMSESTARQLDQIDAFLTRPFDPAAAQSRQVYTVCLAMLRDRVWLHNRGIAGYWGGVGDDVLALCMHAGHIQLALATAAAAWSLVRKSRGDSYHGDTEAMWLEPLADPDNEGYTTRAFDIEPGEWAWLRMQVAWLADADYSAARELAGRLRATAPFGLRCAIDFAFADETAWTEDDCDRLATAEGTQTPRFAANTFVAARDPARLAAVFVRGRTNTYAGYSVSPMHVTNARAAQIAYNLGADAVAILRTLFEYVGRSNPWDDVQHRLYSALAMIQTREACESLAPLLVIGRSEPWELVGDYVACSPEPVVAAICAAGELAELHPHVAAAISHDPARWRVAIEAAPVGSGRDELAALLAALEPAGVASVDDLPVALRGKATGGTTAAFLAATRLPQPLPASRLALPASATGRLLALLKKEPDLKPLRRALDAPSCAELGRAIAEAWQGAGAHKRYTWILPAAVALGAPPVDEVRERKQRPRSWWP